MELLSAPKNTKSTTRFDYKLLSPQQRTIVQQCTGAIKERLRRTAQDAWEVGQKLVEVRSQLEYGQFEIWLSAEFGWSRRTAYNFINVYEAFSESTNFAQLDIATSALYKLAAPSTPKSVRNEFLDKAEKGEKITHKEISQTLAAAKKSSVVAKPQFPASPSPKILQVIPKARAKLEVPEVQKNLIDERPLRQTLRRFPTQGNADQERRGNLAQGTGELAQPQISSKQAMNPTLIEIKSGFWYVFDQLNTVFCGDTALDEFCHRSPEATLALAVTSNDWDHDWLIEKVNNLIVLQESSLKAGLIEQIISLLSAEGDTVILPWLPDEKMLAIAHRLKRRIVAGDPSAERCHKAIAKVGLTVEQLSL